MLTHIGQKSPVWASILKWGGLLLVLAALVGGGLYLLRRGQVRTDLYQAALQALAQGDRATAENHLRALLQSGSRRADVATQLMAILLEAEDYEEAGRFAEEWRGQKRLSQVGWRAAIEIALRQLHLVDAERLAREQADLDPEFAQFTILRVRDLMGTFADRWAAQRAAVAMATLTPSPEMRARTFLFAAETLRDLLAQADERVEDTVRAAYRRAANEARSSLLEIGRPTSVTEPPRIRELRARIGLLSEDVQERRTAELALQETLKVEEGKHEVRASLAAYQANREMWPEAVELTRGLADGPPLLWIRAVQRLLVRERYDEVLGLLREGPLRAEPLLHLYEAQILLLSDATLEDGIEALEALVRDEGIHPGISLQAYRLLIGKGRTPAEAGALTARVRGSRDAVALASLVEALEASGKETAARALASEIASHVDSLPQGLTVLSVLGRAGAALMEAYLDGPIEGTGAEGGRRHFFRAAAAARQALPEPTTPQAEALRRAARRDLERVATADLPKTDLAQGWVVAAVLGDAELVGRLAARAIGKPGPPHDLAFRLLRWAAALQDPVSRERVADGIRQESSGSRVRPFLETLADVIAEHPSDPTRIREAFDRHAAERGLETPTLYLKAQIDWLTGAYDQGRKIAKRLHEDTPGSSEARDLYGAFLVQAEQWEDVLRLHANLPDLALGSYAQMIAATTRLMDEGKPTDPDRTLNLARRAVRENPNASEAHILLAQVLLARGERKRALGILSIAPPGVAVNVLRAHILEEEGEAAVAEGLLRETITGNPHDLGPWRRLYLLLSRTGERGRLIDHVEEGLEGVAAQQDENLRAELHLIRGMAYLERGEEDPALADFERVIEIRPTDSVALNNAAWLLYSYRRARMDDAFDYALRALEQAPENSDVHDTVAMIRLERGELDEALAAANKAVALAQKDPDRELPEKPAYRVHRALIRDAMGDRGLATSELEAVAEQFPDNLAGIRAASILRQWARESG